MDDFASERARRVPSWVPLVIRVALGVIFIAHGSQKVFGAFGGPGMPGVIGMMKMLGLHPAVFWAWLAASAEFLGGLGVLFGALTRIAALGILVNMTVAITKVHWPNGFFLPKGFEFAFALWFMALSLIIGGAGKLSVDWCARRVLELRRRPKPTSG